MEHKHNIQQAVSRFKHNLGRVFDDNLHTKQWQNMVDYAIIGLILLSTLEVFLSTYDNIVARFGTWLRVIDYFTTIIFTIEVTLRIWAADEISQEAATLLNQYIEHRDTPVDPELKTKNIGYADYTR